MYRSSTSFAFLYALCFAAVTSSLRAANEFNLSGTGDLADSVNWSDGVPPAPGTQGKFKGTGDINTFLSSDLSTGLFTFNRPFGQFNIDLQGHTLTSDGLALFPLVTGTTDPFTGGLNLRDGTVLGSLSLDSGSPTLQKPPHTVTSSISNVTWTGQDWFINGKQSINAPGFEDSGKVNVTIDQGSKVTLDRLLVSQNGGVHVEGPISELAFKKAYVGIDTLPQSVSLANIFGQVAVLSADNGATIRTLETNAPIELSRLLIALIDGVSFSASLRQLDLDGVDTRLIAADANLAIIELDISNGAAIETNRPLYVLAEVEITNATASHDLISPLSASIVNTLALGTSLEHKVNLKNATLNGDVTDFRFIDLNNAVLNGNVKGAEAIRGAGIVNGDVLSPASDNLVAIGFLPTGLIDVNGNVVEGVFMSVVVAGHPDLNTPRVEVNNINGSSTLDWTFIGFGQPFGINVAFDPLFHASVGDRFELVRSVETILNPGFSTPGDFLSFPLDVREYVEERLSGIVFQTKPAGYDFNIFIEPHAIGFTVVSVPELSSLALITPPLVVMAIFEARRRRHRPAIASCEKRLL